MGAHDTVSGSIFADKAIFVLPQMACREI